MEFKQLQSFVAVVKYQSFTIAAEKLQMSQPTISTHIRMLEEELYSPLVIRTTKSLEITPKGWELYECALNILCLKDNLIQSWVENKKQKLHLGASTIPSAYILPEILPSFIKEFPDVNFVINQSDSGGIIKEVRNGTYHVGLIGMHCEDELLTCIPFYQDRMVLITPVNEHYLAMKEQEDLSLSTLIREPIILREDGSGSKKSTDLFFQSLGLYEGSLNVTAQINDTEAIKNLVAGGLGISVISNKAAKNFIEEKKVLMFELPEQVAARTLYIVFQKNFILKSYVKSFIEYVEKYYQQ